MVLQPLQAPCAWRSETVRDASWKSWKTTSTPSSRRCRITRLSGSPEFPGLKCQVIPLHSGSFLRMWASFSICVLICLLYATLPVFTSWYPPFASAKSIFRVPKGPQSFFTWLRTGPLDCSSAFTWACALSAHSRFISHLETDPTWGKAKEAPIPAPKAAQKGFQPWNFVLKYPASSFNYQWHLCHNLNSWLRVGYVERIPCCHEKHKIFHL